MKGLNTSTSPDFRHCTQIYPTDRHRLIGESAKVDIHMILSPGPQPGRQDDVQYDDLH